MLSNGMSCICLCGTDMPESGPQLKNMKACNSVITFAAALKSATVSGQVWCSKAFGKAITWLSHTQNLLKTRLWLSDKSEMKSPSSKGGMKGSSTLIPVGLCCSECISKILNGIPSSNKVSTFEGR